MIYMLKEHQEDCIKIRIVNCLESAKMTTKSDYKKKLMEYRKSIGATTKTVAFKETTPSPKEVTEEEVDRQKQQSEALDKNVHLTKNEFVNLEVSSPPPQQEDSQPAGLTSTNSVYFDPIGFYTNWNIHHTLMVSQPWCCVGDLMAFCEKYEFKAISVSDVQTHANIVAEVRALLGGKAPFDKRKRFPGNIRNPENLFVCIGRCPSVEYHLERILSAFRRPLNKLSTEKQNMSKQNFHLAIRELHLDVSARVTEIRLYDRMIFEKDFHLKWQDTME